MRKISKNRVYYKSVTPSSATPKELYTKSVKGKGFTPVFKSADEDNAKKTYTFVGTKEVIDRDGDVVVMDGIDFTSFQANPVVLWGHDSSELPIGKVVGISQDKTEKTTLFDIQFASTGKGKEVEQLVAEGILKAVSIGFMVKEYDYNEDANAFMLTEIELFEISVCNIPANQDALLVEEEQKSFEAKDLDIAELARQVAELIKPAEPQEPAGEPKGNEGTETQEEQEQPVEEAVEPEKGKNDEGGQGAEDEVSEEKPESDKTDLKIVAELLAELVTQLSDKGKEGEEPQEQSAEEPATEDKPEAAEEEVEEAAEASEEVNSSEDKGDNDHSEEQEPETPEEITEIDDLKDEVTYVLAD